VKPAARNQLRNLDRALLALCDERARLLGEVPAGDPGRAAAVEDMLRRHEGPTSPEAVREIFAAVDRHCARFSSDAGSPGIAP
jgi:chorismate mutase